MGFGRGGGGHGWRHRFVATGIPGWLRGWGDVMPLDSAPDQELAEMKQQEQSLSQTLDSIRRRIQQFESRKRAGHENRP